MEDLLPSFLSNAATYVLPRTFLPSRDLPSMGRASVRRWLCSHGMTADLDECLVVPEPLHSPESAAQVVETPVVLDEDPPVQLGICGRVRSCKVHLGSRQEGLAANIR